jgi:hypothetical protein
VREKGEKWVVSHGKEEKLKGRKNITSLAFKVHFSVR